jgi:hypothetical protein
MTAPDLVVFYHPRRRAIPAPAVPANRPMNLFPAPPVTHPGGLVQQTFMNNTVLGLDYFVLN